MTASVTETGFALKLSEHAINGFDTLLLEAVDEALSMLGENCKQTVYHYIKENYKISRHEIPAKIDKFTQAIESIFGVAAKLIEIQIIKKTLCQNQMFHIYYRKPRAYINTIREYS